MSHLSESASLEWASHFSIIQTTAAVHSADMAYTSPSTALNQKESEKAKASAPTTPALRMSKDW